jgi:hypothetical protein
MHVIENPEVLTKFYLLCNIASIIKQTLGLAFLRKVS